MGALASVAGLLVEQGELRQAMETYQEILRMATRPGGRILPIAAPAFLGLAELAYEWNDLETAGQHAQQAQGLAPRWGNPVTLASIQLIQASLHQAQGDTQGSFEALRQAEELERKFSLPLPTADRIDACRVRRWLEQANLAAARRWAQQQALDPGDEITYSRQIAYLSLARILVAQDQAGAALDLLARLGVQFEALGQAGLLLELLLLQALAREAQGDTPGALAALARALALGEPEGYLRVFLDEGAPMAELLRHAGSRGIAPKYVARLLSEFNRGAGAPPVSQQPLIEPLTDRELQVLRLIAAGLSNQAIAERLVVAVGTVKTHTASLYRKLDVTSRTQAVSRASELGLL
jgi:LuxR family maltose regulon positive regulatory protein